MFAYVKCLQDSQKIVLVVMLEGVCWAHRRWVGRDFSLCIFFFYLMVSVNLLPTQKIKLKHFKNQREITAATWTNASSTLFSPTVEVWRSIRYVLFWEIVVDMVMYVRTLNTFLPLTLFGQTLREMKCPVSKWGLWHFPT